MNFLATSEDIKNIVWYMLDELNFTIFEAYSEFDNPIRQIHSNCTLGDLKDKHDNILVRGWKDEFNSTPKFKLIKSANPELFKERTTVGNLAQIQIYKQRLMDNLCLYPSRLSNWSEKGARQRASATQEELDAVDWKALKSHSQKIKRHIRVKISVATLNSMPIMPDAYAKFCNEEFFLWNWGDIIRKESIKIQLK